MSSVQLMADATLSRSRLRRFAILCTTSFVFAGFAAAAAEKPQHQVSALLALLASGAIVLRLSRNRSSVGATTGHDSMTCSSPVQSLAPAKLRVPVRIFDTTGGETVVLSPIAESSSEWPEPPAGADNGRPQPAPPAREQAGEAPRHVQPGDAHASTGAGMDDPTTDGRSRTGPEPSARRWHGPGLDREMAGEWLDFPGSENIPRSEAPGPSDDRQRADAADPESGDQAPYAAMPSHEPLTNRVGPGRVESGLNRVPANADTLRELEWCCIACVRSGRRGEFRVIVLDKDGRRRSIARSPSFRVGRSGRIAARGAARAAHDALVSELIAAGWRRVDSSGAWHDTGFVRPRLDTLERRSTA